VLPRDPVLGEARDLEEVRLGPAECLDHGVVRAESLGDRGMDGGAVPGDLPMPAILTPRIVKRADARR
jgi:hypothetical protein